MKVLFVLLLIASIAIIDAKFKGFSKKQLSKHTLGRVTRETQSEELTAEDVATLETLFDKGEGDCSYHDCVDENKVESHCEDGERCLWLYEKVFEYLLSEASEEAKESEHGDRRRR